MSFPDRPNPSDRALVPYSASLPTRPRMHRARFPTTIARALPQLAFYARLLPITITVGTTTVAVVRLVQAIWRLIQPLHRATNKELIQAPPAAIITEYWIQQDTSGTRIAARQTVINHWKR